MLLENFKVCDLKKEYDGVPLWKTQGCVYLMWFKKISKFLIKELWLLLSWNQGKFRQFEHWVMIVNNLQPRTLWQNEKSDVNLNHRMNLASDEDIESWHKELI